CLSNSPQRRIARAWMRSAIFRRWSRRKGSPLDYDPTKDIQTYAGIVNLTPNAPLKKVCPSIVGGNNYWPSSYSPRTKLLYIPALTGCMNIEVQRSTAFPLECAGLAIAF